MTDKTPPFIPLPGEGKRGEEGHIGYLLRQAHCRMRLAVERALEDLEVTQPQFLVMTMINAYPGSSSADIARIAVLTPQTISLIVANLEKAGRLRREQSPSHGRIQHMELTEEGRTLLLRCRERTHLIEEQLVANLDPEQERIIRRWLVDVATRPLNAGERSKVQGER